MTTEQAIMPESRETSTDGHASQPAVKSREPGSATSVTASGARSVNGRVAMNMLVNVAAVDPEAPGLVTKVAAPTVARPRSALDIIRASIQPVGADPNLATYLEELQQANKVCAVISLYDAFAASAEVFQAIDNQPRSKGAEDCLEAHCEQAWAKAYLCAETLKAMQPSRYDAERYAETLFSCALAMGSNLAEAARVVEELSKRTYRDVVNTPPQSSAAAKATSPERETVKVLSAKLDAKVLLLAEADTSAADTGFLPSATVAEKRAYAKFKKLDEEVSALVLKIFRTRATNAEEMLLKIRAAGLLVDRKGEKRNRLVGLNTWEPVMSGYVCDDAAPTLLAELRDDLKSLSKSSG